MADRKIVITGMVIVGAIILTLIIAGFMNSGSMYNTVSATGTSTISVMPDFISVNFNAQTTGSTAEDATTKNEAIISEMKTSLMALGFTEDEIKTQGFSVYPNYDWQSSSQRITGYTATHTVVIEIPIDEKEKIGSVLDAGINAGAGISYINYELTEENQNKYKADALRAATEDATNKARAIAEGAGQSLGKLVTISSSDFGYVPWMAYDTVSSGGVAKPAEEIARSITPNEQDISAQVTATFKIR